MKKIFLCSFILMSNVDAAVIDAVSSTGAGSYNNSADIIIDGIIPTEGSFWAGSDKVWWNGVSTRLTIDLGEIYKIEDIVISVDNNDTYQIDYSFGSSIWTPLFTILDSYGEIGGWVDTMSTISGDVEYVSGIDFSSVSARYLRIQAIGGDNEYSVGEIQILGTVPTPAAVWLFGSGLIGLIGMRKKSTKLTGKYA